MKKSLRGFLCLMMVLSATLLQAQQYLITNSTLNTGNPGNVRTLGDATTTGGTKVHLYNANGGATVNSWSAKVTIPFAFNFYGSPVTKFVVSKNGLLTFDTTLANTTVAAGLNTNTALPNAALPGSSIAYFWEDFTTLPAGLGTNDDVWVYTEGTAPNRQFWIQNFSYAIASQGFAYWAVVLEETTNKIYVVDMNYASTPASYTGTVGVQINNTTSFQVTTGMNSIAGSPNVLMGTGGTAITDNEYYTFQYFPAGSCLPPTAFSFSNVTSTSVTLSWTGTGISYDVYYGPAGFNIAAPPNTLNVVSTTTPITGLTGNTAYDFYVVQKCSSSISSVPVGPYSLTTPVAPFIPPYLQDFTGSFPPAGYTTGKGKAKNPTVFSGTSGWNSGPFGNTGSNPSARLNVWTTTYADWLFTPTIDLGTGTTNYQLEFDIALTPYSGSASTTLGVDDTIRVVISTDNGLTWNRINTLQAWNSNTPISNTGDHIIIPLTGYTGYVKFGFYGESTVSNADNYVFVDNIKVDVIPACPQVSGFNVTGVTSTSATLNWVGSGLSYDVYWGPEGFNMGTGTNTGSSTTNSLLLTGLTSGTTYDVFITQHCTGALVSANAGPFRFTTVAAPPYLQTFTNITSLSSANFGTNKGKAANPTIFTGGGSWNIGNYANGTGNPSARLNVWTTTVQDWLFTPTIDLGTGTVYQLEFDIALTPYTGTASTTLGVDDTVRVVISTDNGLTWSKVNSLQVFTSNTPIPNGLGAHYVVNLGSYTGFVKFGFYGESSVSNADNYIYIDNIEVRIPPACPQPTSLSTSNISTSGATIKWSSSASTNSIEVEYGITGFTPGTGTMVAVPSGDSLVLTNLLGSTPYQVYVKALCLGSTSVQSGPLSFQTLCDTLTLPWTESFEVLSSIGLLPTCWERPSTTYWVTNTGNQTYARRPKTGTNFLQARYGVNEYVYTPKFHLQAGVSYEFSFWYKADGLSGWDSISTAFGTSQIASAMVHKFGKKIVSLSDTAYKQYIATFIPATTGDYHIGIKASSNSVPWYLTFDDFRLRIDPSPCPNPGNLTTTSVTSSSIGMTWASPSGTSWVVEWGPTGFKQASLTGTIVNVSSLPHTFAGMQPNTYYDFYITAGCGASTTSGVTGPFTFKTDCTSQLSGIYTIGGPAGARNFTTFTDAINALNGCGVTGAVTMNIAPGNYSGAYVIKKVEGASATNTVIFNGADPATRVVNGTGVATFYLEGAKHITIKNLTVANYGSASAGFLLNKNADSNTIEGCIIKVDTVGSSSYSAGITVTNSTTSATTAGALVDYLVIRNNTFTGGYRGVNFYGSPDIRSKGLVIENNTFRKVYYYGMYLYYVNDVSISRNKVFDMRNTFTYGISLNYSDNFDVQRNNLVAVNYGLYIFSGNTATTAPAQRSRIYNNILIGEGTSGLYLSTVKYVDVYNNSMRGVRGFQSFTTSENNYQNNIFYGTTNFAFDLGTAMTGTNVVDYNIYYSGGTNVVKNGTPTFATLAAWKVANPLLNLYSLQGDPVFQSNKDLHVTGTLANDAGNSSLGITVDVDGDVRPAPGASSIDIGADEYTPLLLDAQLVKVLSPVNNSCGDSLTDVIVVIKNGGVSNISGLTLGGMVNGSVNGSLTTLLPGSIASNGVDTVNLGTINTSMGGNFNLKLFTNLNGDQKRSNDTLALNVTLQSVLAPVGVASTDSSCQGQMVVLYLPQIPNQSFEWKTTTGLVIGTTDSLVVGPMGGNDTTFVLAAVTQQMKLGPLNTSIGAAGNFTDPSVQQLYFTAHQAFTLDSMTVFPNGNGNVNINLVDFTTNAILQTVTIAVSGVTSPGSAKRIAVGMSVPAGTYKMHGGGSTTGGLWRNSAGAMHPYSATGIVDITGNSFDPAYYYYFYDWKISAGGCPRPNGFVTIYNGGKLQASFTENSNTIAPGSGITTIQFNGTSSKGATTYTWDFGDGTIVTGSAIEQHTYAQNGTYTVTLTITGPCGSSAVSSTIIVQGIGLEDLAAAGMIEVYPNPFSNSFILDMGKAQSEKLILRIMAPNGVLLVEKTISNTRMSEEIVELSTYPKGLYLLTIQTDEYVVVKRLVKQ